MQAVTIKLFLTDGNSEGIRTAEISNWTGKAIAGPRSELSSFLKREELGRPGVYFLTGVDPDSGKENIYIGEAESVNKRLSQHKDRDNWSHVTVFVSKDENLTKAHIRYLEGALIQRAKEASRSLVTNSASSGAILPESDQADMDVFLGNVLQLLPTVGIDAFKLVEHHSDSPNNVLYCSSKGVEASGVRTSNGFVVFQGSKASLTDRPSSSAHIRIKRSELINQGILTSNDEHYIFTVDTEFKSPSLAGSVVLGGNTNGLTQWKTSEGLSLKEIEADL